MKENMIITFLFFPILIFMIFVDPTYAQVKKIQAWSTPEIIKKHPVFNITGLDTIFPAPALLPEPEYSLDDKNTIKWNNDSIQTSLEELEISLIAYEVQAIYNQTELWGFVNANKDSATFINLPAGIEIAYRLRYIGIDSTQQYGLSYWSEPEISIQDKKPPTIHQLRIIDLQQGENEQWILGNTLYFHIIASDSVLGKVEKICINEVSDYISRTDTISIPNPAIYINDEFYYDISTPEQKEVTLNFWVIDRAGRNSAEQIFPMFWISTSSEMFSFPNPFNPKIGQTSTIKIENQDIKEVRIYDLFGNLIRKLYRMPGSYFFEWDGRNGKNEIVASGGYLCVVPGSNELYCKIAVVR